ncbi:hypothetical protein FEM48_Zijuj04G0197700 [Ziziphus jujuba var. spinosa]|uniref:Uncharacterized protein n=1 Tax=Ziziphus jujuba var. spinosa TaxID=714518 RepID=A0A978VLU4_ZIZJJ|nr:hypothetical protein FEM48_Zijuj04G0197700 [Ziziphus jujuba var. spinosa]
MVLAFTSAIHAVMPRSTMLAYYTIVSGIYIGDGIGRVVIHLVRGEDPVLPSSSSTSHSHPSDSSISTGDDADYKGNMPLHDAGKEKYSIITIFVDDIRVNMKAENLNFQKPIGLIPTNPSIGELYKELDLNLF